MLLALEMPLALGEAVVTRSFCVYLSLCCAPPLLPVSHGATTPVLSCVRNDTIIRMT